MESVAHQAVNSVVIFSCAEFASLHIQITSLVVLTNDSKKSLIDQMVSFLYLSCFEFCLINSRVLVLGQWGLFVFSIPIYVVKSI